MALQRWLLIALIVAPAAASAASADIDPVITDFMAANHIPGLSAGVLKDGEVVLARGFGSADLKTGIAASESTVYPLASLTKQFTATGIVLLAQAGKLSLEDAMADRVDEVPAGWRGITIRQLLNHTSGIPDFAAKADFERLSTRHHSRGGVLKWVSGLPLDFPPGEGWRYSNTNYFLLGLVIESASGQDYGSFLVDEIFQPLRMSATRLDAPRLRISNRAQGYVWKDAKLHLADRPSPSVTYSAGGLVGTVLDFMKWQQALLQQRLLSPAILDEMWTATKTARGETHAYGFGWRVHAKSRCLSHSGHVQGAAAFMAICPKRRFAVVLLANLEGVDLEPLSGQIAEIYSRP